MKENTGSKQVKKDSPASRLKRSERIRLIIQACFAALTNGYLRGFVKHEIYQGVTKYVCVPGMNCYSCPGALGACPIGSLQAVLNSRDYKMAFYVIGFLMVVGSLGGRFVCGFLCPFGLIQDLIHKIPFFKKLKRLPGEKILRSLRFVFLIVFVLILPLAVKDLTGLGDPWFCKYVCPVGTLEGGIPLVLFGNGFREAAGFLFSWKVGLLVLCLLLSLLLWRPFCRYLCPLGAVYGLFNKFAFFRYTVDETKCTKCGACEKVCGLGIPVYEKPNSIDCVRCGKCVNVCPTKAIRSGLVLPFTNRKSVSDADQN